MAQRQMSLERTRSIRASAMAASRETMRSRQRRGNMEPGTPKYEFEEHEHARRVREINRRYSG